MPHKNCFTTVAVCSVVIWEIGATITYYQYNESLLLESLPVAQLRVYSQKYAT